MSRLSEAELARTTQIVRPRLPEFGMANVDALLTLVKRTRRLGYALHDARAADGIKVIGMAACNSRGEPVVAIGVSAIASRCTKERREKVVQLLTEETQRLLFG